MEEVHANQMKFKQVPYITRKPSAIKRMLECGRVTTEAADREGGVAGSNARQLRVVADNYLAGARRGLVYGREKEEGDHSVVGGRK